ncbi:MAG: glycerate kinase [Alphaproteobacteria bacterium]|nr:glycerate kinase [Alphaproteobacteria bacterium SS10]
MSDPQTVLNQVFQAALDACLPEKITAPALDRLNLDQVTGRIVVTGAGKASAAMAAAVESWAKDNGLLERLSGLVVTRYGHAVPCQQIEIVEASHPVPDQAGLKAATRIKALADELSENDVMLCLISGGGSALLSLPAPGLKLEHKQAVTADLLRSGATIGQMNAVRKHLSAIKGGQLAAAAHPARVVTLLISDVPGDDPETIASGPTVTDPTSFAEARAILEEYDIALPPAVDEWLNQAAPETPKPGDPAFAKDQVIMIATPQMALEAAAEKATALGYTPIILGDAIEGESREVAKVHSAIAKQIQRHGQPGKAPAILLSGGETTVTVQGNGRGGRNAEFCLALAIDLAGQANIHGIACDTDGIDGSEDNAGARVTPDSLERSKAAGFDAVAVLRGNDSHGLFKEIGDLVMTGPTLTNVNDFRAILVEPLEP